MKEVLTLSVSTIILAKFRLINLVFLVERIQLIKYKTTKYKTLLDCKIFKQLQSYLSMFIKITYYYNNNTAQTCISLNTFTLLLVFTNLNVTYLH